MTRTSPALDVSLVLFRPDLEMLRVTLEGLAAQRDTIRSVRCHINDEHSFDARHLDEIVPPALAPQMRVTASVENLGFAEAHNTVMSAAFAEGAEHVLVLNPDLALEPTAVPDLLEGSGRLHHLHLLSGVILLESRPTGAGARPAEGARVVDSAGTRWSRSGRHLDVGHGQPLDQLILPPDLAETTSLTGALMVVPRLAWARVVRMSGEFFDADFFAYREDAELGLRARAVGVGSFILPTVVGTHYRGSPGTSRANELTNRLSVRNRFLMVAKLGLAGRPGSIALSLARDAVVVAGTLARERSSLPGLTESVALRPRMLEKRRALADRLSTPAWTDVGHLERSSVVHERTTPPPDGPLAQACVVVPVVAPTPSQGRWLDDLARHVRVVVVDDGVTPWLVPRSLKNLTVLRNGLNLGIAAALNLGIARARLDGADWLTTLDQDSDLSPGSIATMIAHLEAAGGAGVVGPGVVAGIVYPGIEDEEAADVPELLQSGMTTHISVYDAVGLFDEGLFIDGVDTDFCLRVARHGLFVRALHGVAMGHELGSGSGQPVFRVGPFAPVVTGHSPARRYYMNRNRITLLRRYAKHRPRWAMVLVRRTLVSNALAITVEDDRRSKARAIGLGVLHGVLGGSGRLQRDAATSERTRSGSKQTPQNSASAANIPAMAPFAP